MELDVVLERLRHRFAAVVTCTILALTFVLLAELGWRWALAGIAVVALWSALWPLAEDAPFGSAVLRGSAKANADSEQPWAILLGGLSDAALLLDGDGMVVATNALAQDSLQAVPGRHVSVISRMPDLLSAVETARLSRIPATFNLRLTIPVERHLLGRVTPLIDPARPSRSPALLIVLRDLTEQEKLVRLRADFVANASHELKTPLTALRGFLETLKGAARDDATARERFVGIMLTQAERMSRLIDDLLSLSQIEMRQHVVPRGVVDLGDVAREAAKIVEPLTGSAGIAIRLDIAAEPVRVTGDRDELLQVTQNLVQNAIKYGRKGGSVDLAVRLDGGRGMLSVTDDGMGIGAEHLPRLTERFYRVNVRESHMRGGTGLGLAIVKHIVNRHLGELRIASTLGKGSTFTVLLPGVRSEKSI